MLRRQYHVMNIIYGFRTKLSRVRITELRGSALLELSYFTHASYLLKLVCREILLTRACSVSCHILKHYYVVKVILTDNVRRQYHLIFQSHNDCNILQSDVKTKEKHEIGRASCRERV